MSNVIICTIAALNRKYDLCKLDMNLILLVLTFSTMNSSIENKITKDHWYSNEILMQYSNPRKIRPSTINIL